MFSHPTVMAIMWMTMFMTISNSEHRLVFVTALLASLIYVIKIMCLGLPLRLPMGCGLEGSHVTQAG
jgi:hypothetical protein